MRKPACRPGSRLRYRANIKISDEQDKLLNLSLAQREGSESLLKENNLLRSLTQSRNELRVIDLFAGAGGMSTGFLMASNSKKSFRVIGAAEINPIYVKSLEKNHKFFEENATNRANDCCPKEFPPIDLKSQNGRDIIKNVVDREGGVDVLIGGPPCQGFSQSNRNSWSPDNPYNKLVDIFVKCAI
ncbi:MAG: DNA cytosine methyltransferase [Hormoscilla sp. SP5CHS1]|nr:DNA cytosine methyltransferase [Hormoscilla sp. SP5CHS1]